MAEIVTACALIVGCPSVDEEPPALLPIDSIYEDFGLELSHAPYIDEETAEVGRMKQEYEREIKELIQQVEELNEEVIQLEKEFDRLETENESLLDRVNNSVEYTDNVENEPKKVVEQALETFEVTAYTAGDESTGKNPVDEGYGVTASGNIVQEGVTVACPPSMAFGTRLSIKNVGERVCEDRGSDIVEGRLDVYIADLGQALEFGRRTLEVEVID